MQTPNWRERLESEFRVDCDWADFNKVLKQGEKPFRERIENFITTVEKESIERAIEVLPKETTNRDVEPMGGMCLEFADGHDNYRLKALSALKTLLH